MVTALEPLERVVARDDLAEPQAPPAQDAPLAVEHEDRTHPHVLPERALRLNEPALPRPKLERVVLEGTLSALVTDRAVEGVIDEEKFQDAPLSLPDPVGLRADDHVLARLERARGREIRHLLDLDQAHPACAERGRAVMVAEYGDLDSHLLSCLIDCRPLRNDDRTAVDREVHHRHRGGASRPASVRTHPRRPPTAAGARSQAPVVM